MSQSIRNLEPKALWNHFADLNSIPRPSKKEEKVREFMIQFAKSLQLEVQTDAIGNVLIKKSATEGFENKKTVVLQSHLDMVCQKNNDVTFDFDTQGIDMIVEGDFVKANGTTLGADNGIGVAAIMAILSSNEMQHPAIEALFTIDEETGMTGALQLDENWISGEILLNLDTEEDDELDIGCAGGIDVSGEKTMNEIAISNNKQSLLLEVKGLKGGHSGMDIHKGLGNSNKLLARLLFAISNEELQIVSIQSGGLRNAIPREGRAIVAVSSAATAMEKLKTLSEEIQAEFASLEPALSIHVSEVEAQSKGLSEEDSSVILQTIYALHNGVFRMSPDIKDLVEASNNVANVVVENGTCKILCLTRSSVESSKNDVANSLQSVFELASFQTTFSGGYPGWKPNRNSEILTIMEAKYQELFQEKAHVVACHAGLECGIIGSHYPKMDMISFGPNISGAHSPDEKVQISSVQKFWKYLSDILKSIPEKA